MTPKHKRLWITAGEFRADNALTDYRFRQLLKAGQLPRCIVAGNVKVQRRFLKRDVEAWLMTNADSLNSK
ncbi:MAG: hypothetical protein NXI32_01385 [bacterium]|nr:hypothetical protein [bacterium]